MFFCDLFLHFARLLGLRWGGGNVGNDFRVNVRQKTVFFSSFFLPEYPFVFGLLGFGGVVGEDERS